MENCMFCKKEVPELFRFVFEDDGEEAFVCNKCLIEIEGEFYKPEKEMGKAPV